jgi:hypothetical protein
VNNFCNNLRIADNRFLKMLPREAQIIVSIRDFCWLFAGISYKPSAGRQIFSPTRQPMGLATDVCS